MALMSMGLGARQSARTHGASTLRRRQSVRTSYVKELRTPFFVAENRGVQVIGPKRAPVTSAKHKEDQARMRASAGKQARGHRFPELIPEFCEVLARTAAATEDFKLLKAGDKLSLEKARELGVPKGSKILNADVFEEDGELQVSFSVGIYHSPAEFVEKAEKQVHPFDMGDSIKDDLKKAVFGLLTLGPVEMRKQREETFEKYEKVAKEMQEKEDLLHASVRPDRENIVSGKIFLAGEDG